MAEQSRYGLVKRSLLRTLPLRFNMASKDRSGKSPMKMSYAPWLVGESLPSLLSRTFKSATSATKPSSDPVT